MSIKVKFFAFFLAAFCVVAGGGVSVLRSPDFETVYEFFSPLEICDETCILIYRVHISNSGWEEQKEVAVQLSSAFVQDAALPLKVMSFGKIAKLFKQEQLGENIIVRIPNLKPRARVDLSLGIPGERGRAPPPEEVFMKITADKGAVVQGSAEFITFGRFLLAFISGLFRVAG